MSPRNPVLLVASTVLLATPSLVQAASERHVVIRAAGGLDVQPITHFVREAQRFASKITVTAQNRTVNGKDMFKVQTLNFAHGEVMTITAEGQDEKDAVTTLASLIESQR